MKQEHLFVPRRAALRKRGCEGPIPTRLLQGFRGAVCASFRGFGAVLLLQRSEEAKSYAVPSQVC